MQNTTLPIFGDGWDQPPASDLDIQDPNIKTYCAATVTCEGNLFEMS